MKYSAYAKRYPLIGENLVIPTDDLPVVDPITGADLDFSTLIEITVGDVLELQNIRDKIQLLVVETTEMAELKVTPQISAEISGYAAENQQKTIAAEGKAILGTFSDKFETAGKVLITVDAGTGACLAMRLP